jgi:N-acetylglutamate synthase-like GNAT family acetyltransferase
MIRLATTADIDCCADLVEQFLQETAYSASRQLGQNRAHICRIVWTCLQQGSIWLADKDSQTVGILIAVREPVFWQPELVCYRELLWFVRPEYRSTSLGGRLFKKYQETAEKMKKLGEIEGYFTTKMTTTSSIDLERRGFRLTEMTYLKE